MPIPVNQWPIGSGLNPDGTPGADFFINLDTLNVYEEEGPDWRYFESRFIPEAVRDPDAIFQGLERPNQDEGYCYSVRPTHDPEEPEATFIPRFGAVFVAYVEVGIGGYMVFDWEWRDEDINHPGHPEEWQTCFTRRTWLKT